MTGQLAFVESPVQLLNVLEWAHAQSLGGRTAPATGDPADAKPADALTVVVLSPTDPMSRGQLRPLAEAPHPPRTRGLALPKARHRPTERVHRTT
ncbi:hypothetical protein ABZ318_36035, partial [Streptomyces sp. NPDC006197]